MENTLNNKEIELTDIVDSNNSDRVMEEVKHIFSSTLSSSEMHLIEKVFSDILNLFNGNYPGYKKCMTHYHDLEHTMDTFLAMARLIHGYISEKGKLSNKSIILGLISSLMHDTGYIQEANDNSGTGAQYTLTHISRSISFLKTYFADHNFSHQDVEFCENCILCTNINTTIEDMTFASREEEIMGKMMGIADLLSQLANRTYLENLFLLYGEFKEGNVQGFINELDLYTKTLGFFEYVNKRFIDDLENLDNFMIVHFKTYLNIQEDLYQKAIYKNKNYLSYLIDNKKEDLLSYLRRKKLDMI